MKGLGGIGPPLSMLKNTLDCSDFDTSIKFGTRAMTSKTNERWTM